MKCLICGSKCDYYFSKTYSEPPYSDFMKDIGAVEYYRCSDCGFVISKTHGEMRDEAWQNLNYRFHHYHETSGTEGEINQPPYIEQAMMLVLLGRNGLVDTNDMVDYAAGYGCLSNLMSKYFGLNLSVYDPYVKDGDPARYIPESELKKYGTVINSAMFEHIVRRSDLDSVNNIVDSGGCLIIHTVVCENVPKDPEWFYLRPPVHSAFHTNKSMNVLMEQWGYRSSIYSPVSKCWVLLRESVKEIERAVSNINEELQHEWFYCKSGFVDYWKGF